ncbi:hypothetical protein [Methanobrevibacter sp.]|uniref:hypothetical protein n=1 Tax=Methanobrevibacter sp. TaxID=66852 RepID=UPI00388FB465
MAKRKCTVTLDAELVDLHKLKSSVPLSTDLNNYLQESLLVADELDEVNKQIERHEKKLQALRPKQARLEQIKINEINNKNNYALLYDTLERMQNANDCIGKNQIRLLAEHRNVDFDGLLAYAEEEGFKIVEVSNGETRKQKQKTVGMLNGDTSGY